MLEILLEIRDAIDRNKLRTIATGVAVASGLFLLIVLLGASNGIIHTLEQNSEGLALDVVNVWPWRTSKPYNGMEAGRAIRLDTDDQTATLKRFPNSVRNVGAQVEQAGLFASYGKQKVSVTLNGVYPDYLQTSRRRLLRGRFINAIDIQQQRRVCVIDEKQRRAVFGEKQTAVGKTMQINGSSFLIIGILNEDNFNNTANFFAPISTVRTIYAKGKGIEALSIRTQGKSAPLAGKQFEKELMKLLATRHEFDPTDESAVWIESSINESESIGTAKSMLNTSFWILGLLTLLSGIVGVSNIMLITVKERTHEFGIRKALGARPWNIIGMVILESVIITTFFGYIGMLAGIGFCQWMDANVGGQTMDAGFFQQQYFIDPTVGLSTCIQATVVMVIAGALAGFFPAWRAARVKPIEALRG
jgi:putative ABC transport system permease protein